MVVNVVAKTSIQNLNKAYKKMAKILKCILTCATRVFCAVLLLSGLLLCVDVFIPKSNVLSIKDLCIEFVVGVAIFVLGIMLVTICKR